MYKYSMLNNKKGVIIIKKNIFKIFNKDRKKLLKNKIK